jgi:hypothetical protein
VANWWPDSGRLGASWWPTCGLVLLNSFSLPRGRPGPASEIHLPGSRRPQQKASSHRRLKPTCPRPIPPQWPVLEHRPALKLFNRPRWPRALPCTLEGLRGKGYVYRVYRCDVLLENPLVDFAENTKEGHAQETGSKAGILVAANGADLADHDANTVRPRAPGGPGIRNRRG